MNGVGSGAAGDSTQSVVGKSVVVKGVAGLGNRILALLTACLYARLAGRTLYVDWRDGRYADPGDNAFPRLFRSPCCQPYPEGRPSGTVWPEPWAGKLDRPVSDRIRGSRLPSVLRRWKDTSADLSSLDYPADTLVVWALFEDVRSLRRHLKGPYRHLRREPTKSVLRSVLAECLSLEPGIQARVDAFRDAHLATPTIGVHVRHTDRRSRLPVVRRRLDSLVDRHPDARVFLATDNVGVLEEFRARYGPVLSTEKWYPDPGRPMHHYDNDCPDRVALAADGLVDLHLLASCDVHLWDESSSFAYVARLLTRTPAERIHNLQPGRFLHPELRHRLWRMLVWLRR